MTVNGPTSRTSAQECLSRAVVEKGGQEAGLVKSDFFRQGERGLKAWWGRETDRKKHIRKMNPGVGYQMNCREETCIKW